MKFFQILTLVFGLSILANAQNATLSGTVYDQSGAVVPKVEITLINKDKKRFKAFTNEDGIYTIVVSAGNYSIEAEYLEHQAWEKFRIEKYELAPIPRMNLDITLRVSEEYVEKHGTKLTSEPEENNKNNKRKNNK